MVTVHEKPGWEEEREIRMEKLSETQARILGKRTLRLGKMKTSLQVSKPEASSVGQFPVDRAQRGQWWEMGDHQFPTELREENSGD